MKKEMKRSKPKTYKTPKVDRYWMYFSEQKNIGIIDLSNIKESAEYKSHTEQFIKDDEWIYKMRDGDGDFYYIQTTGLCTFMSEKLFSKTPSWF